MKAEPRPNEPSDAEVDAVLEEFGGDARAAIRALLQDIETLARGHDRTVSRGYVRGMRVVVDRARDGRG